MGVPTLASLTSPLVSQICQLTASVGRTVPVDRELLGLGREEIELDRTGHLRGVDARRDADGLIERRRGGRLVEVERADVHLRRGELDGEAVDHERLRGVRRASRIRGEGHELVAGRPVARGARHAEITAAPRSATGRVTTVPPASPTVSRISRGAPAVNERSGASVGAGRSFWKFEA